MGLGHIPPFEIYRNIPRIHVHERVWLLPNNKGSMSHGPRSCGPRTTFTLWPSVGILLLPSQESRDVPAAPDNWPPGTDLGLLRPLAQPGADAIQRRLHEVGTASEERREK